MPQFVNGRWVQDSPLSTGGAAAGSAQAPSWQQFMPQTSMPSSWAGRSSAPSFAPPAPVFSRVTRMSDGTIVVSLPRSSAFDTGGGGSGDFSVPDFSSAVTGGMGYSMAVLNQFLPFFLLLLGLAVSFAVIRRFGTGLLGGGS